MVRLTVLYGMPENTEEFDRYYHEVHIPLAKTMKGLKKWQIAKVVPGPDGEKAPYYMQVDLFTDTLEDFAAILSSPEGKATVDDVPNFATGGVTFIWSEVEDII